MYGYLCGVRMRTIYFETVRMRTFHFLEEDLKNALMGAGRRKYAYYTHWYSIWHAAAKIVLAFFIYALV